MSFLEYLVSRKSNNSQKISLHHIKKKVWCVSQQTRLNSMRKKLLNKILDLNWKQDSNPYLGVIDAKACIPTS